jgi:hypothetical protein
MRGKRATTEQIIAVLREAEAGAKPKDSAGSTGSRTRRCTTGRPSTAA